MVVQCTLIELMYDPLLYQFWLSFNAVLDVVLGSKADSMVAFLCDVISSCLRFQDNLAIDAWKEAEE